MESSIFEDLTKDQLKVLEAVMNTKNNLFIKGKAGTGKSFLIDRIREYYTSLNKKIVVLAPTGVAAYNISGSTFHSHFGLNIHTLETRIFKYLQPDVYIIDEISMVGLKLFEKIYNRFLRHSRLIVFGDLHQLEPIKDVSIIQSNKWLSCKFVEMELTTMIRQDNSEFINILNELRKYPHTKEALLALKQFEKEPENNNNVYLFGTNNEKNEFNSIKLNSLEGEEKIFLPKKDPKLFKNKKYKELIGILPQELVLKKNARVMCVKNLSIYEHYIYNGSLGTVIDYTDKWIYVLFDHLTEPIKITPQDFEIPCEINNNKIDGIYTHFPIVLGFSFTVHKVQGITLESCVVDCKTFRDPRVLYVACSRVKSPQKLYIKNLKI
jgi:ATP-dependent DNA helicase PIF1